MYVWLCLSYWYLFCLYTCTCMTCSVCLHVQEAFMLLDLIGAANPTFHDMFSDTTNIYQRLSRIGIYSTYMYICIYVHTCTRIYITRYSIGSIRLTTHTHTHTHTSRTKSLCVCVCVCEIWAVHSTTLFGWTGSKHKGHTYYTASRASLHLWLSCTYTYTSLVVEQASLCNSQ